MSGEAAHPVESSARKPPQALAALLLFAFLVRVPLLTRPLTSSHTDNWRQADTASVARHFYREGYQLLYPQVYWGGSGPGYAETEFQLHPFVTALLYGALGERVWLGRLVSLVFAMLGLWLFYLLARRLAGERNALFGLAFLSIAPLHLRYSTNFMPEATVFCFYLGGLYFFQRWLDERVSRWLWCAAASTAVAVLVKPTSIQIGLIFLLLLWWRERFRFLSRVEIWGFASLSLAPAIAWYWHARQLYLTYGNTFGIFSGGDSKFGDLSYWLSRKFYSSVLRLELEWAFAWGGIVLFLGGAFAWWRRHRSPLPWFGMATAALYYLAVARYAQEPWGIQYHIYFLPFAALLVGAGLGEVTWSFNPAGVVAGIAALLTVGSAGLRYRELFERPGEPFARCGGQVAERTPKEARLVVSTLIPSTNRGIPVNYQEPDIFFFSDRRGWSLPADRHSAETLEALRRQGASYFVAYNERLVKTHPDLTAYLATHAEQVGPGFEFGCAIYRLSSAER